MPTLSKSVASRILIARTVRSTLDVNGDDLAVRLAEVLFPDGTPASLTLHDVVRALGELLQRRTDDLAAADLAHLQEQLDDDEPRTRRDQATASVRKHLGDMAALLGANFGDAVAASYGLSGTTPSQPEELLQRARAVVKVMREVPLKAAPRLKGVVIDLAPMADALAESADALDAALADVLREQREAQTTLKNRNACESAWNDVYPHVAAISAECLALIGEDVLAERVRPTSRRRAGMTEAVD